MTISWSDPEDLDRDICHELALQSVYRFEYMNSEHMPNYMTITFAVANFVGYILARLNRDYMDKLAGDGEFDLDADDVLRLHQASMQWFCELLSICYQQGWKSASEGSFDEWTGMEGAE